MSTLDRRFLLAVRLRIHARAGALGRVASAIADAGGEVAEITPVRDRPGFVRDLVLRARNACHAAILRRCLDGLDGVEILQAHADAEPAPAERK